MNIKFKLQITDADRGVIIYDKTMSTEAELRGIDIEKIITEHIESWYNEIRGLEKLVAKKRKERKRLCKQMKKGIATIAAKK